MRSVLSCLTLCDPRGWSPPASSAHGIFQARILEWAAISFSRGSSQPRGRTRVSCMSCLGRGSSLPLSRLRNLMMGDAEMGIHRVAGCAGGGIQDEASHLVSAAGNCHPGEGQGGGPGISRQQPAFQRGSTSHPPEP